VSSGQGLEGLVGSTINGYHVTRFIARGGMGAVFEATQVSLERQVAIKFLYPYLSDDPTFRDRFQREARSIARLNHPNIVRVLDFGSYEAFHYMVMDLIDSESLRARLVRLHKDGARMDVNEAVRILQQVGNALTYAHSLGMIHRDVKPGNVLLGRNGQAFLADFGVVKLAGDTQITTTGTLVGTPDYMAPEQSTGTVPVGPAADQYSLAIIAYEMLTARVPFQAPTPVAVLHKHVVEPPLPPRSLLPWIPADTEAALLRALAKNPADRFETVDAFVYAFGSSLTNIAAPDAQTAIWWSGQGPQTPPPNPHTPTSAPGYGAFAPPPVTGNGGATPPPTGAGYPQTGAGAGQPPTFPPYAVGPASTPVSYGGPPSHYSQPSQPSQPSYPGMTNTTGQYPYAGQGSAGGPPMTPPPAVAPVPNGSDRSPALWQGLGVLALLVLVVGGYLLFLRGDDQEPPLSPGAAAAAETSTAASVQTPTSAAEATDEPTSTSAPAATDTPAPAPTPTEDPVVSAYGTATAYAMATAAYSTPSTYYATPEGGYETPTIIAGPPEGYREVILFASHRGEVHDSQIYIMNPDGSDQQQITFARGHSWGPRVSPDGTQFFFSSVAPGEHQDHGATGGGFQGTGNHDVYLASVDGTNITKITHDPAWENAWSWSPDGKWIALTIDRDGNWDVYLMTTDGGNFVRVTTDPAADGWPSFTPDGRIVFASERTGTSEIYIMDADGTNIRQLTDRPETFDTYPFVSPDGKKIVFSSQFVDANEGEIYVMDIDGSNLTRLTSTVALNYAPSWSPDGSKIVFVSDRGGNHDIFVMDADGKNIKRLTTDPGEDTTPVWAYIKEQ
jgi:Tol biopolymer transport system component/serine/threonine protein kinase